MRSLLLILLFCMSACPLRVSAQSSPLPEEELAYRRLQALSGEKLNISTPASDDSLLLLARRVERLAESSGNTARRFKAGQIQANAYGLSGNFALAASKAQQLLDEAVQSRDQLTIGLALQAIGDTYMHSERFELADSIFTEAAPHIMRQGDVFMQVQLQLQHLHTYLRQLDTLNSRRTIKQLRGLLDSTTTLSGIQTYRFLLSGREVLYALSIDDMDYARQAMTRFQEQQPQSGAFEIWTDRIGALYYMAAGDLEQAQAHSDSALSNAQKSPNPAILRTVLCEKALLLERTGQVHEACKVYREIDYLTDSLHEQRYTSQIDSLHVTYWTDQLQVSNITRRNKLYNNIIIGLLAIAIAAAFGGVYIRRRNRQLRESRLKLEALRETAADSIRTKSLFLSNMSHELRTPLNAIVGFSTILTEDPDTDEATRQQCSSYIRQNGDLLLKLITDVVDFAKLQDKSFRFTPEHCEIVALCRNVVSTIDNVKRTEAELHFDTDLEQLEMQTDPNRLQQVLINLLVNATKFTPSGHITLSLHTDTARDEAVFAVEDTGCGIPLEKQPRIFERFEKLHEGIQGAGLGLSICKLIVDYGGGRIWIDPAYTQGARFVFTHPLHANFNNKKA